MRQETINFVGDIDGTAAAETVHFMLDGVEYEIDLNDEHAADLRDVLREHVANGRRVGGRAVRRQLGGGGTASIFSQTVSSRERAQRIRDWATENGLPVSPRGRLSVELQAQYEEAQRAAAEPAPVKRHKRGTTPLARTPRRRATRTVSAVRGA